MRILFIIPIDPVTSTGKMAERSKACDSSFTACLLLRVSHLRMEAGVRISLLSTLFAC